MTAFLSDAMIKKTSKVKAVHSFRHRAPQKGHMVMTDQNKKTTSGSRISVKQVIAIIGIILLVALYVLTLVMAFIDKSASGKLFLLCLYSTVAIPILLWIYIWIYNKVKEQKEQRDRQ